MDTRITKKTGNEGPPKAGLLRQYEKEIADPVARVLRAAEGLPVRDFDELLSITKLNKNQLAGFINLAPKTIDNYRIRRRNFSRMESEQILQMLGLYAKALEIFGRAEAFNGWLKEPTPGLGGRKGFDLLYTPGGIQLVLEELIRIEFGATA